MPNIITANLLRSGDVVYLGDNTQWVREIGDAVIANSDDELSGLEALAEKAIEELKVIGAYPMEVDVVNGKAKPKSVREVIRAAHGPTV